jgi:hypothetical protein
MWLALRGDPTVGSRKRLSIRGRQGYSSWAQREPA